MLVVPGVVTVLCPAPGDMVPVPVVVPACGDIVVLPPAAVPLVAPVVCAAAMLRLTDSSSTNNKIRVRMMSFSLGLRAGIHVTARCNRKLAPTAVLGHVPDA